MRSWVRQSRQFHREELISVDALLKPPDTGDTEPNDGDAPPIPLAELDFVKAYVPEVDKARDGIIQEMETMVVAGLADLVSCA